MEILDGKAVVIKTRMPEKYTIIPKSRVLETYDNGGAKVAVFWGLDEMRVLRNLGVKGAPSPILRKYDWPGRFKPMAHQIETAAFLTLHRRAFCFNDPGCVDADTEYLSPTGWKRIAEYDGSLVAQFDPATGAMSFVRGEYVKLPCDEMVRVKTKYGVDQLLSPEHRCLIYAKQNPAKYEVLEAAELHHRERHGSRKAHTRIGFSQAAIKTTFTYSGAGIGLSAEELRLQVAVIADGYFPSSTRRCVVRLKKERKKERLRLLLQAAGVAYKERAVQPEGFTAFTFYAPTRDKVFDSHWYACSQEELQLVVSEVQHWDSNVPNNPRRGWRFSTYSQESADFVQFACAATGHTARILTALRERRGRVERELTVQVRPHTQLLGLKGGSSGDTTRAEASTDGYKYCFMVPSTFLVLRRNGCIFTTGNTGKTLSALWAADYLMRRGEVRRVLVLCPLSIMHSAWMGDLNNSIIHRTAIVAHHSKATRRIEMIQGDYEFVITNYEGLNLIANEVIANGKFDLVIVDEANAYKNSQTQRWRSLAAIIRPDTYLWMMTGTPASQSPEDAYGLAKLVNPSGVPKFRTAWRDKVMTKLTQFKWVPKPDAAQLVHEALQPAIRYSKEDCLDLPPVLVETRDVPMTPQQQKYYKLLKEQMLVQAAGETISAVNAGVALSKLLQISAGAAYTDDKEVVEFDASPRLKVLLEVLEETNRKVIIFAMFRSSIDTIMAHFEKNGMPAAQIHGGVSATKRAQVINDFQTTQNVRVLVMQPQATAHGITLTAADTVVFYGPLMSVEMYLQCIARADRKGQDAAKVTVVHIQSSPVEVQMFRAMRGKVNDHTLLVDMFNMAVKAD